MKVTHRLRVAHSDAHYADNLVSGAYVLGLFGDVATELLIHLAGDEGLFRAYESVEFLQPVKAGDFLEVTAELVSAGRSSRKISFNAYKVITMAPREGHPHGAKVLEEPLLCVKALGTCVIPV